MLSRGGARRAHGEIGAHIAGLSFEQAHPGEWKNQTTHPDAAEDRGAAGAGGIRRAQNGANFDDDAGGEEGRSVAEIDREIVCSAVGSPPDWLLPQLLGTLRNKIG